MGRILGLLEVWYHYNWSTDRVTSVGRILGLLEVWYHYNWVTDRVTSVGRILGLLEALSTTIVLPKLARTTAITMIQTMTKARNRIRRVINTEKPAHTDSNSPSQEGHQHRKTCTHRQQQSKSGGSSTQKNLHTQTATVQVRRVINTEKPAHTDNNSPSLRYSHKKKVEFCEVGLLVAKHPSNDRVQHKEISAGAIVYAATLRWKLQIRLALSPSHSKLTPDQPGLPKIAGMVVKESADADNAMP